MSRSKHTGYVGRAKRASSRTEVGLRVFGLFLFSAFACTDTIIIGSRSNEPSDGSSHDVNGVNEINRWQFQASGVEDTLNGVFAISPTDVWAVGDRGVILHFDGESWQRSGRPTLENLMDVWASSPSDVWAVGDAGTIVRFDGTQWSNVTGVFPTLYSKPPDLVAVSGSGPNNVWIAPAGDVTLEQYRSRAVVARFDGSTWTLHQRNDDHYFALDLTASRGSAWIIGHNWMERWNGRAWEDHELPSHSVLFSLDAVYANSAGTLCLIAYENRARVFLQRQEGWEELEGEILQNQMRTAWSTDGADLWLAGEGFALGHFDGSEVRTVIPPSLGRSHLLALSGSGGVLWGVGPRGIIARSE